VLGVIIIVVVIVAIVIIKKKKKLEEDKKKEETKRLTNNADSNNNNNGYDRNNQNGMHKVYPESMMPNSMFPVSMTNNPNGLPPIDFTSYPQMTFIPEDPQSANKKSKKNSTD
jgi:hypothetical protein